MSGTGTTVKGPCLTLKTGGYPLRKQRKAAKNLAEKPYDNVVQLNKFLPKKKQRVLVYPKNLNQENYLLKLQEEQKNIVFAIGPAGTGKTMLACQWAVKMFQDGEVDKIVVTRPAVSVDEQHGFLPFCLLESVTSWTAGWCGLNQMPAVWLAIMTKHAAQLGRWSRTVRGPLHLAVRGIFA